LQSLISSWNLKAICWVLKASENFSCFSQASLSGNISSTSA
jgi:hypothetical protein